MYNSNKLTLTETTPWHKRQTSTHPVQPSKVVSHWMRAHSELMYWFERRHDTLCKLAINQCLLNLQRLLAQDDYHFLSKIEDSEHATPSRLNPWIWQNLIINSNINGGLLSLFDNHPVPLHDHPGVCGVLLVLSGRITVRNFNLPKQQSNIDQVTLQYDSEQQLGSGEIILFDRVCSNIHGIQSLSSRSLIMDVILEPDSHRNRSWYFPITDSNKCKNSLMAHRITNKHKVAGCF